MPKRTDIKSVLIIGAGPIVIGQACEFDYSGAQACKALREEGYRVILVNSNPATIMTDPDMADAVYIEPINPATVERIIAKEKPANGFLMRGIAHQPEIPQFEERYQLKPACLAVYPMYKGLAQLVAPGGLIVLSGIAATHFSRASPVEQD